jgi:hypothetical protein
MDNQAQLMANKQALITITNTSGWRVFTRFAQTVLTDLERKALLEEDDAKASGYRRDARGARLFWEDVLKRVELAKNVSDEPTNDDFVDIACD